MIGHQEVSVSSAAPGSTASAAWCTDCKPDTECTELLQPSTGLMKQVQSGVLTHVTPRVWCVQGLCAHHA